MQRFKNILFIATPETSSEVAFERAINLAESNQASLTVIKVVDEILGTIRFPSRQISPETLQKKLISDSNKELETLVASCSKKIKIQIKVLVGTALMEIVREVLRGEHDLVIKAAKIDDERLMRGFASDDINLLRKCPCPVLLIRLDTGKTYRRIVAAVDVDDSYLSEELQTRHLLNIEILKLASSMALAENAEIHIVHAWRAVGESMMQGGFIRSSDEEVAEYVEAVRQQHVKTIDSLVDEIGTKLGAEALEYIKPTKHLLKGWPRNAIPDFVNKSKVDLVVMGTVGRTGVSGFIMGNTAETILNHINCSVLAIKPEGFKTPVTLDG